MLRIIILFISLYASTAFAVKVPFFNTHTIFAESAQKKMNHRQYNLSITLDRDEWHAVPSVETEKYYEIRFRPKQGNDRMILVGLSPFYQSNGESTQHNFATTQQTAKDGLATFCKKQHNSTFVYEAEIDSNNTNEGSWHCGAQSNNIYGRAKFIEHENGIYNIVFFTEHEPQTQSYQELEATLNSVRIYGF